MKKFYGSCGLLKVLAVFAVILINGSCSITYSDMVNDFNSMFTDGTEYDYTQMMTQNCYTIPGTCVLFLEGPEGFSNYTWTASVGSGDNAEKTVICSSKNLTYKLPGVFSSGEENILILTVEDSAGEEHEDRANVIIYSHR